MLLAFTGLVPAHAASSPAARAEVNMSANGNFQLVFAGSPAQVVGAVTPMKASANLPSGTVTLLPDKGSTPLGTGYLTPNEAFPDIFILDAPPLPLGTHYFRAAYSGDANFAPKTIRFPVVVHTGPQTRTTLTAAPSGTSAAGQSVKFTAQVSALKGPMTFRPVGSVIFSVDGIEVAETYMGTGWRASFTTSALGAGRHVVTAEYSHETGDFYGSTSPPVTHTVTSAVAEVKTELHSSHHGDIPVGHVVAVQAVIAPRVAGQPTPTGSVQFYDWNTKVGAPVQLVNGKAGFKYTGLKPGKHILNAKYLGSTVYAPGDTPARTVTVVR